MSGKSVTLYRKFVFIFWTAYFACLVSNSNLFFLKTFMYFITKMVTHDRHPRSQGILPFRYEKRREALGSRCLFSYRNGKKFWDQGWMRPSKAISTTRKGLLNVTKIRMTFKTNSWEHWESYSGLIDQNNLLNVLKKWYKFGESSLTFFHLRVWGNFPVL